MGKILRFTPPGRGFFVFLDYLDDDDNPAVFFDSVTAEDAFAAAGAILRPVLERHPEFACRTLGSMAYKADPSVCEVCVEKEKGEFCVLDIEPEAEDFDREKH